MQSQLEIAKRRLFGSDAIDAANIKLYPGSSRDSTAEEMAEQVNKALSQIESGDFEVVDRFDD